jgi:hypothetical protein
MLLPWRGRLQAEDKGWQEGLKQQAAAEAKRQRDFEREAARKAFQEFITPLFVSASSSFWPPKAVVDCQTLSFSASFYKIRLGKNHPKST